MKCAVGHHLPNHLKGMTVHSAAVACSRMVMQITRGRKYGEVSDRKKFTAFIIKPGCKIKQGDQLSGRGGNNNKSRPSMYLGTTTRKTRPMQN